MAENLSDKDQCSTVCEASCCKYLPSDAVTHEFVLKPGKANFATSIARFRAKLQKEAVDTERTYNNWLNLRTVTTDMTNGGIELIFTGKSVKASVTARLIFDCSKLVNNLCTAYEDRPHICERHYCEHVSPPSTRNIRKLEGDKAKAQRVQFDKGFSDGTYITLTVNDYLRMIETQLLPAQVKKVFED